MKTLKQLRPSDINLNLDEDDDDDNDENNNESDDLTGNTLVALHSISVICDDFYSVLGDDNTVIEDTDMESILEIFNSVSALHEKYGKTLDMPSNGWVDDEGEEDLKEILLQKESYFMAVQENELQEELAQKNIVNNLTSLGFAHIQSPSKNTYVPAAPKKIDKLFGIPMRAGKYADTFFVMFDPETTDNIYGIVTDEGINSFANTKDAMQELQKVIISKNLKESIIDLKTKRFAINNKVKSSINNLSESDKSLLKKLDEKFKVELTNLEIVSDVLLEAFDETKFKRLALTGLVPPEDVTKIMRSMKMLDAGKALTTEQKNLISSTFLALVGLVTGDTSVFSRISSISKSTLTTANSNS